MLSGRARGRRDDDRARLTQAILEGEQARRSAELRVLDAVNEVARLRSEIEQHAQLLEQTKRLARQSWVRHHQFGRLEEAVFTGTGRCVARGSEDHALVERIIAAYARSEGASYYGDRSMWVSLHEHVRDVHEALMAGDVAATAEMLRDPATNRLLYGFEVFTRDSRYLADGPGFADFTKDVLVRLAEALAVARVEHAETIPGQLWRNNIELATADIVASLEGKLGVRVAVEPVHRRVTGLEVGGGLITVRMLNALYLAHRARQLLAPSENGRVLEIGAGLGYAAWYARQLGLRDYTIVDLPLTAVASAYFLGRVLGSEHVVLDGELDDPLAPSRDVKILTPAVLGEHRARFDLVVNMNSLTEVGPDLAVEYATQILRCAPCFLSVNHEADSFTVNELFADNPDVSLDRFPYWLRNGFVEEIVTTRTPGSHTCP